MMMEKMSQEIVHRLSELVKVVIKSSEESDKNLAIDALYKSFESLTSSSDEEVERLENTKDFGGKIEQFFFISSVLKKVALLPEDKKLAYLIKSSSLAYTRLADEMILIAISYYSDREVKSNAYNRYAESMNFKNKKTDLQYKMKHKMFDLLIEREATNFLKKCLSSMGSLHKELIEKVHGIEDREHAIIYPDLIEVKNVYRPSTKEGWYDWSVSIAADDDIMNRIKIVNYILHPTFLENEKSTDDPTDGFKLDATGWGEFEITANIQFKDPSTDTITKYHWLNLGSEGKG
jgi:hypothetical protein